MSQAGGRFQILSITRISARLFDRSLKGFGYHCDCKLVWFMRKLKQKKYRSRLLNPSDIGKCIYPKRFVNKKLQDLTEDDVCPQLPRIGTINSFHLLVQT